MSSYNSEQISLVTPREVQALDVQEKVVSQVLQQTRPVPEDVYAMMRMYSGKLPKFIEDYQESMDTLAKYFDADHQLARNLIAGASLSYLLLSRQASIAKVRTEPSPESLVEAGKRHKKRIMEISENPTASTEPAKFIPTNIHCINVVREIASERPVFGNCLTKRLVSEMDTQDQHAIGDYLLGAIIVYDAFVKQAHEDALSSFAANDSLSKDPDIFGFPLLWHPDMGTKFPIDYDRYLN
jgi:hypothetical protein